MNLLKITEIPESDSQLVEQLFREFATSEILDDIVSPIAHEGESDYWRSFKPQRNYEDYGQSVWPSHLVGLSDYGLVYVAPLMIALCFLDLDNILTDDFATLLYARLPEIRARGLESLISSHSIAGIRRLCSLAWGPIPDLNNPLRHINVDVARGELCCEQHYALIFSFLTDNQSPSTRDPLP